MWQLLLSTENQIFSVALALMLLIALLEGVATLLGAGFGDALDTLLPEHDVNPHAEIGLADSDAALSRFLGWLRVGQVPVLMLLVLFLLNFGLTGLLLQAAAANLFGQYLPMLISVPLVLLWTFPALRVSAGILHAVMPKDETSAVSADSLIGRIAIITLGQARLGYPAEAKVLDQHGFSHYIQLEPDQADVSFAQGAEVLLLSRHSGVYQGILNPNQHLSDRGVDATSANHHN